MFNENPWKDSLYAGLLSWLPNMGLAFIVFILKSADGLGGTIFCGWVFQIIMIVLAFEFGTKATKLENKLIFESGKSEKEYNNRIYFGRLIAILSIIPPLLMIIF